MVEVKKPHLPSAPASESFKQQARTVFESLRDELCQRLERFEPSACFQQTPWKRTGEPKQLDRGGGVMSVLCGDVFEKAGVHTSTVYGRFSEEFRDKIPGCEDSPDFWASGVSLIVHPRSPHIPTAHMNLRMIATGRSWLGGGADLTPMLERQRNNETKDAIAFHAALRGACDKHNPDYYARFQEWCDTYFFLPHRNEARGIGGIFYDYLDSGRREADLAFAEDVGAAFLRIYPQIVEAHINEKWSKEERREQLHRRGRYVEFNLLYDRGTIFGLRTGGNVEAILSSLPPLASWS